MLSNAVTCPLFVQLLDFVLRLKYSLVQKSCDNTYTRTRSLKPLFLDVQICPQKFKNLNTKDESSENCCQLSKNCRRRSTTRHMEQMTTAGPKSHIFMEPNDLLDLIFLLKGKEEIPLRGGIFQIDYCASELPLCLSRNVFCRLSVSFGTDSGQGFPHI